MTEQAARYDRIAGGYARWWAPVIAPSALAVLDVIEPVVASGATRILDVGTGTGTLAIAAIRRWPGVRVTGIDVSAGMAEAARAEADRLLDPEDRSRLDVLVAPAHDLPLADGSIDVAISSFVLQLVPNRYRVLREVRRVLRPGGAFAWITWMTREGEAFLPDDDFDDALEEVGEEPRGWDPPRDDIPDPASAEAQMRRAGYREVRAVAGDLVHPFTPDEYVAFMSEFDEEDLVSTLEPEVRARFEAALRRRLARRTQAQMALRHRTVTVTGRRT
ncbi:MAG TPA: class I SAM-dependent methyltransferase [Candidatus Limnocylindrales bacterium]|nr:class I SAM-dependent methyltransferase [Candidatus Limnocylindrales bacterium]